MRLDDDCAALVARLRELNAPRYETLSPAEARALMAAARAAAAVEPPLIHEVRDVEFPGSAGPINARIYSPSGEVVLPLNVFFHGGGWVLGDLESHDILCRRLALAGNCRVFAVDYRLAPENKFPAAVDDASAAINWVFAHTTVLGADPRRIGIAGDSAGANLAAVVSHHLKRNGGPRLAYQVLIYPVVDLGFNFPSHQLAGEGIPVVGDTMKWFRDHYLASPASATDWRASPLLASDFSRLPPAYVLTAGYDPLANEGGAYAEKLSAAGVPVTQRHYPGQIHGFLTMGVHFPTTESAIAEIGAFMRKQVQS